MSGGKPLPIAFADAREDQFPIRLYAFDHEGRLVWDRTVNPYVLVDIPGGGPGSVRFMVVLFADGTGYIHDTEGES